MKKRKRKKKKARTPVHSLVIGDDVHLHIGSRLHDPAAWAASIEAISDADRAWFEKHPGQDRRRRMITPVEMRATGYPPATEVVVVRSRNGSPMRLFLGSPRARNPTAHGVSGN